jgi:hypothetical protein
MMQSMTSPATLRMIDEFWAERLGCAPRELYARVVIVHGHRGSLAGYHGVYAFRRDGGACVVSAPAPYVAALRDAVAALTPQRAFDVDSLAGALGDEVERVVGPARIAYADAGDFRRVDEEGVRLLEAADDAALRALAAACGRPRGSTAASVRPRAGVGRLRARRAAGGGVSGRGATTSCTRAWSHPHRGRAGARGGERGIGAWAGIWPRDAVADAGVEYGVDGDPVAGSATSRTAGRSRCGCRWDWKQQTAKDGRPAER